MAKLSKEEIEMLKNLMEKANEPDPVVDTNLGRPVIVCNATRGVYFGYAKDTTKDSISLTKARNIFYWVSPNKGIFGLATDGPGKGSKVGPEANCEVKQVTNVIEVEPKAVKVWEKAKWE